MKTKYTKQDLLSHSPCKDGLTFAESLNFDFAKIYETCERGDWMVWLLRKSKTISKEQSVLIACEVAERVLELFEKKYPSDKRPRQAIEAARNWAKNPTEENRAYASAASADAADAAAYDYASAAAYDYASAAAYTAYAAAYTAYAAYAADYTAAASAAYDYADASDAASVYAAAAYAASDAADYTALNSERKWQADKIRELIPNPFTAMRKDGGV